MELESTNMEGQYFQLPNLNLHIMLGTEQVPSDRTKLSSLFPIKLQGFLLLYFSTSLQLRIIKHYNNAGF